MGCCASQQEPPVTDGGSMGSVSVVATRDDLRLGQVHTPATLTSRSSTTEFQRVVSPTSLEVHSGVTNRGPSLLDSAQYVPLGNPFVATNHSGLGSVTNDNLSDFDVPQDEAELTSTVSAVAAAAPVTHRDDEKADVGVPAAPQSQAME